jgi:pyruvate/2-oxoglutarate dehydrogenase complex dihydrolipoamide acyltransferase (E2) component
MLKKIVMPGAGQTTDRLTIGRWLKSVGDTVIRGDVLLEVETDKAIMPLESFASGILLKIFLIEGDIAYAGDVLAYIGDESDYAEGNLGLLPRCGFAELEDDKIQRASPAAKKAARDANIPLENLGHITNNIIRKKDVERHINTQMLSPVNTIPSFTLEIEADVSQLQDMLKRGLKATIHDVIAKCAAAAAAKYPLVNASFTNLDDYGIKRFTAIINPPENCILAVGAISNNLYLDNGVLKERFLISITASFDHRIVDSVYGAAYLSCLRDYLENPIKLALL